MDALRAGTTVSSLDGGGINSVALEEFVAALVSEVTERSSRAGGLPDVLLFLHGNLDSISNLDASSSLGEKYAEVLIECLTSSKSETRAAASVLLTESFNEQVIGMESIRKAAARLKPAKQRSVGPQIAALEKSSIPKKTEKEDANTDTSAPTTRRQHVPTSTQHGQFSVSCRQSSSAATHLSPSRHRVSQRQCTPDPTGISKSAAGDHSRHPLVVRHGPHTGHSAPLRSWPEYPEEPQGSSLLAELKRSWAPLLPPVSLNTLFPSAGIKKQDDAKVGCQLLSRALDVDRSCGSNVAEDQLEFLLLWLVYVLCSKETAVGLQALLLFTKELLSYLLERSRQLSDKEALVLVPFLLEKASIAKVGVCFYSVWAQTCAAFFQPSNLTLISYLLFCSGPISGSVHGDCFDDPKRESCFGEISRVDCVRSHHGRVRIGQGSRA